MIPKKRILLVEDEESIRTLYARTLRQAGYDVTEAEDGEEAYKLILSGNFDLVLLDIMLPSIDGVEVLRKVREEDTAIDVKSKFVMITNLDFDSVKEKTEKYKVDGYLVKSNINVLYLDEEIKKYFQ